MAAVVQSLLFELGANVASLRKDLDRAYSEVTRFTNAVSGTFNALGKFVGIASVGALMQSWVKEAAEAEKQEAKLAAALRIRGIESKNVLDILTAQAKQMQNTTIFSDEEINRAYRFALNLNVLPSRLQPVLEISMKIAKLYDLELNEAITKVSMGLEGTGRGFRMIDPALAKHLTQLKTWEERFKLLQDRFASDMPNMETYTETVKKFDNQWKEFGETLGSVVLPSLTKIFALLAGSLKAAREAKPGTFMPGEFTQFQDMFGDEQVQNAQEINKILQDADKQFKRTPPAADEKAANKLKDAMIRLNREREEAEIRYANLYKNETQVRVDLIETEWKRYQDAGVKRSDFDKMAAAKRTLIYGEEEKRLLMERIKYAEEFYQWQLDAEREHVQYKADISKQYNDIMMSYDQAQIDHLRNVSQELSSQLSEIGGSELGKLLTTFQQQKEGTDIWSQKEDAAYKHYERMQELYQFDAENRYQIDNAYYEWTLTQEEKRYRQMEIMGIGYLSTASQLMSNLYRMGDTHSNKMFKLFQAFKIAETIISTISGAMKTYDAVLQQTENPYVAAAAAAAYTAFGMAQVATIASTSPGSSAGKVAGGYSSPATAEAPATERQPEALPGSVMNIYVYGSIVDHDGFAREIIPAIMKAQEDGVQ